MKPSQKNSMHATFLLVLVLFGIVFGCQGPKRSTTPDSPVVPNTLKIVATTGMVADLVRQIGGD
ncbi:MAG TPA: hypothetical protein VM260_04075, partial [Pirellula sp.]|nr:hypothetical protein [Pirellula sp.]